MTDTLRRFFPQSCNRQQVLDDIMRQEKSKVTYHLINVIGCDNIKKEGEGNF